MCATFYDVAIADVAMVLPSACTERAVTHAEPAATDGALSVELTGAPRNVAGVVDAVMGPELLTFPPSTATVTPMPRANTA